MTKKTAAAAAPAKPARKKAAPKIVLKDYVLYALLRREGLFGWKAFQVYETEAAANEAREYYEAGSIYGTRGYKVDRVDLVTKSIDEIVEALEAP